MYWKCLQLAVCAVNLIIMHLFVTGSCIIMIDLNCFVINHLFISCSCHKDKLLHMIDFDWFDMTIGFLLLFIYSFYRITSALWKTHLISWGSFILLKIAAYDELKIYCQRPLSPNYPSCCTTSSKICSVGKLTGSGTRILMEKGLGHLIQ